MFNAMKIIMLTSYAHTMVKPPDPIRTPKLSTIGPVQYCGGGPRGNRRWCTFFTLTSRKLKYYAKNIPGGTRTPNLVIRSHTP